MSVIPGGLAAAMGALSLDGARQAASAPRAAPAKQPPPTPAPATSQKQVGGGFQEGLLFARAVNQPAKAQQTQPPPNPNLPRGSLIDLKV